MYTRYYILLNISIFFGLAGFSNADKIRCNTSQDAKIGKLQYSVRKLEEDVYDLDGLELKRQGIPGAPENPAVTNIMQSENLTSMLIRWTTPGDDSVRALRAFTITLSDTMDTTGRIYTYLMDLRNNTADALYDHMGEHLSLKCEYEGLTKYERLLQIDIVSLPQSSNPTISDKSVTFLAKLPKRMFVIRDTSTLSLGQPQNIEPSHQIEIIVGVAVSVVVIAAVVITTICFIKSKGCSSRPRDSQPEKSCESKTSDRKLNYEATIENGNISQFGNKSNNGTLKTQMQEKTDYSEYKDIIDVKRREISSRQRITEENISKNVSDSDSAFRGVEKRHDKNCPMHRKNLETYNEDIRSSAHANPKTHEDLQASVDTHPKIHDDLRSSLHTYPRIHENVTNEDHRSNADTDDLMAKLAEMNEF